MECESLSSNYVFRVKLINFNSLYFFYSNLISAHAFKFGRLPKCMFRHKYSIGVPILVVSNLFCFKKKKFCIDAQFPLLC